MLEGYRQGLDTPRVIEEVLGITPEELDAAVDALLEARFGSTARGLKESGPEGQGTPLQPPAEADRGIPSLVARADAAPANFALQIQAGIALHEAGRNAEAIERFERARRGPPPSTGARTGPTAIFPACTPTRTNPIWRGSPSTTT